MVGLKDLSVGVVRLETNLVVGRKRLRVGRRTEDILGNVNATRVVLLGVCRDGVSGSELAWTENGTFPCVVSIETPQC